MPPIKRKRTSKTKVSGTTNKIVIGASVATLLGLLTTIANISDFAHEQLGFVRQEDLHKLNVELARMNAQLEIAISMLEEKENDK